MNRNGNIVKRWFAGVLAVTMLSSVAGTPVFAVSESDIATPENAAPVQTQVTDWTWTGETGLVWVEDTSSWTLSLQGSQLPETASDLVALLPASIDAQVETDTPESAAASLALTWDTSALTFPLTVGTYTVTASLPDSYTLAAGAPALAVTVAVAAAAANRPNRAPSMYSIATMVETDIPDTIDTVSPVGTTINLFDYWFNNETESTYDFVNFNPPGSNPRITEYNQTSWYSGINQNHILKFTPYTGPDAYEGSWYPTYLGKANPIAEANRYTNSRKPFTHIVDNKLENGYPKLSGSTEVENSITREAKRVESPSSTESLAYLFDPGTSNPNRRAYTDVKGLLKVDEQTGSYTYDSDQNYAYLDKDTKTFNVYADSYEGFFPFNPYGTVTDDSQGRGLVANHFFGLTMTSNFVQPANGETANGQPVTYEFSGDDDVWVFIDGILVGDLGGIHQAASLKIDFASGDVIVNADASEDEGYVKTDLRTIFQSAGEDVDTGFDNKTFADGTYHTLQLFYLERGANTSNLKLKFNLVSAPESTLESVDQGGNGVSGTTFTLKSADQDYNDNNGTQLATGTTSNNGKLVLKDTNGQAIGLQDLWTKLDSEGKVYSDPDNQGLLRANLILHQQLPDGYRGSETIRLYLLQSGTNILLLSDKTWETGSYAYSNSTITLNGSTITLRNGSSVDLSNPDQQGVLFAVVLRRDPTDIPRTPEDVGKMPSPEKSDWHMMTGNATDGWQMDPAAVNNDVSKVLALYDDKPNNFYIVKKDDNGNYETTVSDLPGDVTTYYYMLDNNSKAYAEYNIAFYYTSASSISEATAQTTWMVQSTGDWNRIFSTNVYVANIKNYLIVQQLDPEGNAVSGSWFTLAKDDGTLTMDAQTTDLSGTLNLEGAAYFPINGEYLTPGTYTLTQKTPAKGYVGSETSTKIIVDSTGVYADAGKKDDDVQVARGVGAVVKSLAEFASSPDIDATLYNIVGKFYTAPSDTIDEPNTEDGRFDFENFTWRSDLSETDNSSDPNTNDGVTYHPSYYQKDGQYYVVDDSQSIPTNATTLGMHMEYGASDKILEYGPSSELSQHMAENNSAVYWMTTDEGWSNMMIEQCKQHSEELKANGRSYEDLTGQDLTHLFSRTVVVRVTDQVQLCDLTISKTIGDTPVGNDTNQVFTANVALTPGTLQPTLADSYYYTGGTITEDSSVTAPKDGALSLTPVTQSGVGGTATSTNAKTGSVQLLPGQKITIKDVPFGTTFTVTESAEGNAANYTVDYEVVPAEGETSEGEDGTSGEGTPPDSGDSGTPSDPSNPPASPATAGTGKLEGDCTVNIINTRITDGSVEITNNVDGAMGSYSDTFSYTLNLYDAVEGGTPANISKEYTATITKQGDQDSSKTVTITFNNGQATQMTPQGTQQQGPITLTHGETLTIQNLPAGATFEALETDGHNGYSASVEPAKMDASSTVVARTGLVTVPKNDTDTPTITFTNTRDAIIPTGLREENNPYIAMVGLAGLAAVASAAGWIEMRRRKRREEE